MIVNPKTHKIVHGRLMTIAEYEKACDIIRLHFSKEPMTDKEFKEKLERIVKQ